MVTEVLVQIGALMAPFLAIDKIIKPEHRAVISKYLFADLHASFQGFESAVIGGLMSPFMRDDRLVWQRVFVFSVVVCWIWGFLNCWI